MPAAKPPPRKANRAEHGRSSGIPVVVGSDSESEPRHVVDSGDGSDDIVFVDVDSGDSGATPRPEAGARDVPTELTTEPFDPFLHPNRVLATRARSGTIDGIPLETKVPCDGKDISRGWLMRGRLPDTFALGKRDGSPLQTLLAMRPAERGEIVMFGKLTKTPRYHLALLRDYVFTGVRHKKSDAVLPEPIGELLEFANSRRGEWHPDEVPLGPSQEAPLFNSALVNWYMDGTQYMGPHADDERELHNLSPIFSFTVGATRTFRIRDAKTNAVVRDIPLRDGEWLVMGGRMQREFKHEVVKVNGAKGALIGPRVNITFRQMV